MLQPLLLPLNISTVPAGPAFSIDVPADSATLSSAAESVTWTDTAGGETVTAVEIFLIEKQTF